MSDNKVWETLADDEVISTLDDSKLPSSYTATMRVKEMIDAADARLNRIPKEFYAPLGFLCQRLRPNSVWQRGWLRIKISIAVEFRPDDC